MAAGDKNESSSTPIQEESGGLLGSLASWAGSAVRFAAESVNSVFGFYDDLEVYNPDAGSSTGAKDHADETDKRQQHFTSYRDYIGMDITSLVTLPVWIMEPFSILQRMAEIMEYHTHLDTASSTEDQYDRLAWVLAFTMGPYGAMERTWKPFNPILGETFEVDLEGGVRFFAEQVSHHPPIGVGHGENENWTYDIVSAPSTKFLGNSVEVYPIGRSRIKLKSTGEVFTLVPPNVKANNVIVGSTWIDNDGAFSLVNTTTGARVSMYFTPCGWFGSGRYQMSGHIISAEGKKVMAVGGLWNEYLDCQRCDEEGDPLPTAEKKRLWECVAKPEGDIYKFTHFAHKLMSGKGINPLPSDARRRRDRLALQLCDNSTAGTHKHLLEEAQRADRREREARGEQWQPRWFKPTPGAPVFESEHPEDKCPLWEFTGEYFKQPKRPAQPDDDCGGEGFNPWQYKEIHSQ